MKEAEKLFHGFIDLKYSDGYTIPHRFNDEHIAAISSNDHFHQRTKCGASITLEFITSSNNISFDYKFFLRIGVESTFEVFTNGFLTHMVKDCDLSDEGNLNFEFEQGEKHIEIYLPNFSEVGLKNLTSDCDLITVPEKSEKILFIGDSITQGGGSKRSGMTYVNVVKRALKCEVLNWGIGSYTFDKQIIGKSQFVPGKIVVAMGTNNRWYEFEKNEQEIDAFFEKLDALYPNVPILTVIPPWSGEPNEKLAIRSKEIKSIIEKTVIKYPKIKTINAYNIIPHFPEYYMEDLLHPNSLGMAVYGFYIAKAIKEL